ncbi:MAG: hypothetical protein IJA30_07410 [Bacilli bacterium]|nr:hypothetical protein [Bacilli bacterium]
MKEYTKKEMKILEDNPYTLKVTKNKLSHTAEFKKIFWTKYQAGESPRKILTDLGYDTKMFGQKRIDSMVQRIKAEALSGNGFSEGSNRTKRMKIISNEDFTPESFAKMQHEVLYLKQEVEFLKKITKEANSKRRK